MRTDVDGLPHGFPFRLVEFSPGTQADRRVTVLLSANGFFSRGMGWSLALLAEVLAQSIAWVHGCGDVGQVRLAALRAVRLFQEVSPGDRLEVELHKEASAGSLRSFVCRAWRAGAPVAEAKITVAG